MFTKHLGFAIATALALGAASPAYAATSYTRSVKYFDDTGNLVGQQLVYCSNQTFHGGNIHTAYTITEVNTCTDTASPPHIIVPGSQITAYTLPANITITQECPIAQCIGSGEYPDKVVGVNWVWYSGYQ